VLGLQRAFAQAGTRTVVASLWQVDDATTRALMTAFYDNLWHKNLPRLEALRQAQLAVLNGQVHPGGPRGLKVDKAPAIPAAPVGERAAVRLWAAWVLSGDPGDLTAPRPVQPVVSASAGSADANAVVPEEAGWPWWTFAAAGAAAVLVLTAWRAKRRRPSSAAGRDVVSHRGSGFQS
jgi:hypothetical protein